MGLLGLLGLTVSVCALVAFKSHHVDVLSTYICCWLLVLLFTVWLLLWFLFKSAH